jgi:hypothetical protein
MPSEITLDSLLPFKEFMNAKELLRLKNYVNGVHPSNGFTQEEFEDFKVRKILVEKASKKI